MQQLLEHRLASLSRNQCRTASFRSRSVTANNDQKNKLAEYSNRVTKRALGARDMEDDSPWHDDEVYTADGAGNAAAPGAPTRIAEQLASCDPFAVAGLCGGRQR
jgi:hypothetical protein